MKTTWEQLNTKSIKTRLYYLTESQIELKQDFKSIRKEFKKDPTCSILLRSLNSIHNDIMDNKSEISYCHSQLNKIYNKSDSHIIQKDKKIFHENSTNSFTYKTYILCFDIDSFEIYETTHITKTEFRATDSSGLRQNVKFEDIIQEGTKEELIIELSKIQDEINNISEYKEWQHKYNESKKRSEKQDKKRKAFEKKIKELKENFEASLKEETASLYEIREEMYKLTIKIRRQKEEIYKNIKFLKTSEKGLKNDNN